jgi:FkbM family methyltransferase
VNGIREIPEKVRYRLILRRMAGPRLVRAFAQVHPDATFVEIGANDGDKHDHLRPHILANRWRGVLVEPVPYLFRRLEKNYAGIDRLALANVAIADRDGELPFYYLREAAPEEAEKLPDWYDAIGSFSRENVMRHVANIPGLADRLVEVQVPCFTFASLCAQHELSQVDLVAIDTEGYDGEIIGMFPFDRFRPQLFVYEHYHLTSAARTSTAQHLRGHGYETMEEGLDTFALARDADPRLVRKWRRLRPAVSGVSKQDELRG